MEQNVEDAENVPENVPERLTGLKKQIVAYPVRSAISRSGIKEMEIAENVSAAIQ